MISINAIKDGLRGDIQQSSKQPQTISPFRVLHTLWIIISSIFNGNIDISKTHLIDKTHRSLRQQESTPWSHTYTKKKNIVT